MSKINDGGTAFPYGQKNVTARYSEGLSMRDYFAAAALTGLLNNKELVMSDAAKGMKASQAYAAQSYMLADAMIAARKEGA